MRGPRKQWVFQRAFELMKEAWTAKDELRDSNSAEAADRAGDARSTYRLIRALGAFRTTTLPGIKLADGSFALNAEQENERWNEQFATLLFGNIVDTLVEPPVPVTPATHEVEEAMAAIGSLEDEVQRVVTSLPNNKALGKAMIPSKLWKAGCEVTCNELTLILDWIPHTGDVPAAWRGGRLARLYKGKGPRSQLTPTEVCSLEITPPRCAQEFLHLESRKPLNSFVHLNGVGAQKEEERTEVMTWSPHLSGTRASTRSQRRFCLRTCLKHSISCLRQVVFGVSEARGDTNMIINTLERSGVDTAAASHLAPIIASSVVCYIS